MKKEILYFSAMWCSPCKMLTPRMETLSSQINYRKIDVDTNKELALKYNVRNIPTLVLIENETLINKLVGLKSEQEIINFYNG